MAAQENAAASTALPLLPASSSPDGSASTVGHVVTIDGYDSTGQVFLARNNFGLQWGASGRFGIPLALMTPSQIHSAVAMHTVCGPPPGAAGSSAAASATAATLSDCPAAPATATAP